MRGPGQSFRVIKESKTAAPVASAPTTQRPPFKTSNEKQTNLINLPALQSPEQKKPV